MEGARRLHRVRVPGGNQRPNMVRSLRRAALFTGCGVKWTDRQSLTSVREDGAKVGAFLVNGIMEWWGYSPEGHPTGPHPNCEEAKRAVDSALPLEV